jgi:hypothetical protein
VFEPVETAQISPMVIGTTFAAALFIFVLIVFLSLSKSKKEPSSQPSLRKQLTRHPSGPHLHPTEQLEFGGKGTGNGLFQDAGSIAVDKKGQIYVSDDTLRVQQFNDKGEFLKVIQVPANGRQLRTRPHDR